MRQFYFNVTLLWPRCAVLLRFFIANSANRTLVEIPLVGYALTEARFQTTSCTSLTSVEYTDLYALHEFIDIPFSLARVRCVPNYTFSSPATQIPSTSVHVHFLQTIDAARAAVVGILAGLVAQARTSSTVVFVTVRNSSTIWRLPLTNASAMWAFFDAALWTMDDVQAGCSLGLNPFVGPNVSTIFIVAGDLAASCTSAEYSEVDSAFGALLRGGVQSFWLGAAPAAPPFVVSAAFAIDDPLLPLYTAFTLYLNRLATVACSGDISFAPTTVSVGQRSLLTFHGVCDIGQCCVGGSCSSLVLTTGQRVQCYTPVLYQVGQFVVSVVTRDQRFTTNLPSYITVVTTTPTIAAQRTTVYTYRPQSEYYFPSFLANITVQRSVKIATLFQVTENATRSPMTCCRLVGLTAPTSRVMGLVDTRASVCLNGSATTALMSFDTRYRPAFREEMLMLGLQCYTPKVNYTNPNYPVINDATRGKGDIVWSIDPQNSPSPLPNPASDLASSASRTRRINAMITHLLSRARTFSLGQSLEAIIDALDVGELRSSYPSVERPCQPNEVPTIGTRCFFKWTQYAKDAANYLLAAGFKAVATDWYLSNALVGDIVIFPALNVFNDQTRLLDVHPFGHIAMKWTDDASQRLQWVSDFVHTKMVYENIYTQVDSYRTPTLFRLTEAAEYWPLDSEELVPVAGVRDYVQDSLNWVISWVAFDKKTMDLAVVVSAVAAGYNCPANNRDTSRFPQQLWSSRIHPTMNQYASICYRLLPGGTRTFGVRCCYDRNGGYISSWPSQIEYAAPGIARIQGALEPEMIACLLPGRDTDPCRLYRTRRPAPPATNNPFNRPSLWSPNVRWGGAVGDPHCMTYDGTPFECNFQGEARWTECGNWSVHAVAQPLLPGSNATVITRVAVRYLTDTVVIRLPTESNVTTVVTDAPFLMFLNGLTAPLTGVDATYLSVVVENRTVTIADAGGNYVRMLVFDQLITLATIPSDACVNKTTGLTGNNNGDERDDFVAYGTNVSVPHDSTNDTIYATFVLSHLITDSTLSLFPAAMFYGGNMSFVPQFINATELNATCPAACNGDMSCCFDVAVGGPVLLQPYLESIRIFSEANALAVPLNVTAVPPVFVESTARFIVTVNSVKFGTTFVYVAQDATGPPAVTCDVCGRPLVAGCTTELQALNRTKLTVRVVDVREFTIYCNATNDAGATVFASTVMYSDDSLVVVSTPVPATPVPPGGPISIPGGGGGGEVPRWTPAPASAALPCCSIWISVLLLLYTVMVA